MPYLPHGSIAAAHKLTNAPAPAAPRQANIGYYSPTRPDLVSPEQQEANRIASTLQCPQGVAPKFRHLILIGTGEGCAHCGTDSITIIDQHNRQENNR